MKSFRPAGPTRTSSIEASLPRGIGDDAANVMRQALAGMLWSKQYFGFDVDKWLEEHGAGPSEARRPTDAE